MYILYNFEHFYEVAITELATVDGALSASQRGYVPLNNVAFHCETVIISWQPWRNNNHELATVTDVTA